MLKQKKKKKPSISKLKKKLWKACSLYIRLRDKGICFTCGRFAEGPGFHAGHFIPSSICGILLKYDEDNIHGQCFYCNINLGGYGARYHQRMVEEYGEVFVQELWEKKNQSNRAKWTEADYTAKTLYYTKKYQALLQSPSSL